MAGTTPLPAAASGQVQRVDITFAPGTAKKSGITVLGDGASSTVIGYDSTTGKVFVDRTNSGNTTFHPTFASIEDAPVTLDKKGNVTLRVYVDRSSVEVFSGDGLRTITDQVFPNAGADKMALFAEGGTAQLKSLTVTPPWKDQCSFPERSNTPPVARTAAAFAGRRSFAFTATSVVAARSGLILHLRCVR